MSSPLAQPRPWELVAGDYAAEIMPNFARFAARALELAQVRDGADIVDVACGPGTLALLAAPRCNRVAALDFAEPMIAALRAHVGYAMLGNIDARVGDGQALPFGDHEFDAGFSMFGLMFFPDRAAGLRELRRVVKPGGRIVLSSWLPADDIREMRAVFAAIRAATPGPPPPPFVPPLSDPATIRDEVAAAGFGDVDVQQVTYDVAYASTAAMCDSLERTLAPLALMRERLGPDAWPPIAAQIRASIEQALGSGPQAVPQRAWLTVATA